MVPVFAAQFTGGIIASPVLAAVVTVSFWSLSEISCELETPFADGPNQLPMIDMHERFVEVVRGMYLMRRPRSSSSRRATAGAFAGEGSPPPSEDEGECEAMSRQGEEALEESKKAL
mmetsp:Transcript_68121/g.202728  ORF Transcript_68121/g.202728 Transcript_68121/m.202728 type:complete len:117 (-) Transcript_68121:119-469(-)